MMMTTSQDVILKFSANNRRIQILNFMIWYMLAFILMLGNSEIQPNNNFLQPRGKFGELSWTKCGLFWISPIFFKSDLYVGYLPSTLQGCPNLGTFRSRPNQPLKFFIHGRISPEKDISSMSARELVPQELWNFLT